MVRLAAVLLALLTAPAAAAELGAGPPADLAVEGPLDCGVPYARPINVTCAQQAGEVCAVLADTTCWALRLVCTHVKGPVESASGGTVTCGQQPGCCAPCQDATCTSGTRSTAVSGPDCANYGIRGEIAVGDRDCGSGCTNHGIEVEVRLGTKECGTSCENTGISVGAGGSSCQPSPVWVCTGSRCWWLAGTIDSVVAPPEG